MGDLTLPTVGASTDAWGGTLNTALTTLHTRTNTYVEAPDDGTTSAVSAIQAYLDDARDAGGGTLYVPPGDYLLDAVLRIYGHTRLVLDPGATFIHGYDGAMLLNGDASQTYGLYTGHGDIVIEGGTWDMKGADTPTAPAMAISLGHAENILVRGVTVKDVPGYHAVEVNACKNVRIVDCRFLGFVDTGGREFSEAVQVDLAKSSAAFGGFGPYDHTPCDDVVVSGCYFGASGTSGTTAWPRGVGSHSATITVWHERLRVTGCYFDGLTQWVVYGYNWRHTVISNNVADACGGGIRARTVDTADTEDTKDTAGVQTSASQAITDWTITGNVVRGGTGYGQGIDVYGESTGVIQRLTITGNVIDDITDKDGIRITYCQQATVTGNTVALTGTYGVMVSTCTDVLVAQNQVHGASRMTTNTYSCIAVASTTTQFTVIGNRCRPYASGNVPDYGLEVTGTCSGGRRYGNDITSGSWGTTALSDGASCTTATTDS